MSILPWQVIDKLDIIEPTHPSETGLASTSSVYATSVVPDQFPHFVQTPERARCYPGL